MLDIRLYCLVNNKLIILIEKKDNTRKNNNRANNDKVDNSGLGIKIRNVDDLKKAKKIKVNIIINKFRTLILISF